MVNTIHSLESLVSLTNRKKVKYRRSARCQQLAHLTKWKTKREKRETENRLAHPVPACLDSSGRLNSRLCDAKQRAYHIAMRMLRWIQKNNHRLH